MKRSIVLAASVFVLSAAAHAGEVFRMERTLNLQVRGSASIAAHQIADLHQLRDGIQPDGSIVNHSLLAIDVTGTAPRRAPVSVHARIHGRPVSGSAMLPDQMGRVDLRLNEHVDGDALRSLEIVVSGQQAIVQSVGLTINREILAPQMPAGEILRAPQHEYTLRRGETLSLDQLFRVEPRSRLLGIALLAQNLDANHGSVSTIEVLSRGRTVATHDVRGYMAQSVLLSLDEIMDRRDGHGIELRVRGNMRIANLVIGIERAARMLRVSGHLRGEQGLMEFEFSGRTEEEIARSCMDWARSRSLGRANEFNVVGGQSWRDRRPMGMDQVCRMIAQNARP